MIPKLNNKGEKPQKGERVKQLKRNKGGFLPHILHEMGKLKKLPRGG
jgi:hypothetical protein